MTKRMTLQRLPPGLSSEKYIRVYDYHYPIDFTFKSQNLQDRDLMLASGDLETIKRVTKIAYDRKTGTYEYELEDKFPNIPSNQFKDNIRYYLKFLENMADQRAYDLAQNIKNRFVSKPNESPVMRQLCNFLFYFFF